MGNLSLEEFADFYIEAVSEAVQENCLSNLDVFYEHVFTRVSERTGFSVEEVKSIHHPFHWCLFLKENPPLELFALGKMESGYGISIRQKNFLMEKEELATRILKKYRPFLQQKLDNILNHTNQ